MDITKEQLVRIADAGASMEVLCAVTGLKEQRIKTIIRQQRYVAKRELDFRAADKLARDTLSLTYAKIDAGWGREDLLEFLAPRLKEIHTLRYGV